jgi:hypothetical protein
VKVAALLTLLLSHGGYWFGGHDQHLMVRRELKAPAVSVVMEWHLLLGETQVAGGKVPFDLADKPTDVLITTPAVHERTDLSLNYSVRSGKGDAVLQTGQIPVHLFPTGLITDHARAAAEKRVVVFDGGSQIAAFLREAKLSPTRVDKPSRLGLLDPDILFVGPNESSRGVDEAVMTLVRNGCSVFVFAQPAGTRIHGWAFSPRATPSAFVWDAEHPLFRGLSASDLQSLVTAGGDRLVGVQMPVDAPAIALASWPSEIPGNKDLATTPTDCLIVTQTLGRGRLVLCQLPLPDWSSDPRMQILLNNALSYLLTRPEPTPPPSERTAPVPSRPINTENRIPLQE